MLIDGELTLFSRSGYTEINIDLCDKFILTSI